MPNHYHLLVQVLTNEFSRAMQSFGQSYTNSINRACDRVGPLFQGRFEAKCVDDEAYLLHVSRYIHLNPHAAGLVARPEDWEFSSYPEYVGLRSGSLPKASVVLQIANGAPSYRLFVEAGVGLHDTTIGHLVFAE